MRRSETAGLFHEHLQRVALRRTMNRNGNTACYHHRCQYWSAVVDQHLACPGAGRRAPERSKAKQSLASRISFAYTIHWVFLFTKRQMVPSCVGHLPFGLVD